MWSHNVKRALQIVKRALHIVKRDLYIVRRALHAVKRDYISWKEPYIQKRAQHVVKRAYILWKGPYKQKRALTVVNRAPYITLHMMDKSLHTKKIPTCKKNPIYCEKSPSNCKQSLTYCGKNPLHCEKSPTRCKKWHACCENSPNIVKEKARTIKGSHPFKITSCHDSRGVPPLWWYVDLSLVKCFEEGQKVRVARQLDMRNLSSSTKFHLIPNQKCRTCVRPC